jgi:hypothetical protein
MSAEVFVWLWTDGRAPWFLTGDLVVAGDDEEGDR